MYKCEMEGWYEMKGLVWFRQWNGFVGGGGGGVRLHSSFKVVDFLPSFAQQWYEVIVRIEKTSKSIYVCFI